MQRSFSDAVVHSSNIDDCNSSEEEEDPLELTKKELQKSLNEIPSFSGGKTLSKRKEIAEECNVSSSSSSTPPKSEESEEDTEMTEGKFCFLVRHQQMIQI